MQRRDASAQVIGAANGGGNWLSGVVGEAAHHPEERSAWVFSSPLEACAPWLDTLGAGGMIGDSVITAKEAEPVLGEALTLTCPSNMLG